MPATTPLTPPDWALLAGRPRLTVAEIISIIGTELGNPSKMPGRSFGLSAHDCQTGGKLHDVPDSTCSDCYALKGRYIMPGVKAAHTARMEALRAALADPALADLWVRAMATRIRSACAGEPFFRWHDSGDLQSVAHLRLIVRVAEATPGIMHWIPTRERGIVRNWYRAGGRRPENLSIRLSDAMRDATGRTLVPGCTSSGVHDRIAPAAGTYVCPAPTQGNVCGDCRACWSPDVAHVSYHRH